ncbi:hypothetical protein [Cupriavidus sp. DF5525]|uniref:hypothetical protein n=1 Tax=Cupriavidus sp. DF5525 TaxID=3160989 RepID=UPI0032E03CEA
MHVISNFAATVGYRQASVRPRSQQVLLRHWGFSEQEAASLLPDLPDLDGRLKWTTDARATPRPDLVIHLVDATRLSGVFGGARWNAMGPVDAMEKAFRRGTSELALVLGSTQHLPQHRHGCWILSGANSLAGSIDIIARTMIEPWLAAPDERPWSVHDVAATNTLCLLSKERALDRDTLARRLAAAVGTALSFGYATPARVAVAAEAQVMDHAISQNLLMRDRLRMFRRRPSDVDLSAEILVAYPWPTGLTKYAEL